MHPRFAQQALNEALTDTPVVLIHGPRQCGKSTLAQLVGAPLGYSFFTFDDPNLLAAAQHDPVGFLSNLPPRVVLDEVQRVPELFAPLKQVVDRHRTPGRFMLTGSSNVLLLPHLADSLAGRMEVLRLHPLSQDELLARPSPFLNRLFEGEPEGQAPPRLERLGQSLTERLVGGGYPAALERPQPRRRTSWYLNYIDTLVQRDVRALSHIRELEALPRLLAACAAQSAQLFNLTDLASPFQLSRPTIGEYVTLLERIFLVERLPPWHHNQLSRLIKTPKLHLGDTGLLCALRGYTPSSLWEDRTVLGAVLETFVFQELRRQVDFGGVPTQIFHLRDKDGVEVDLVLERGGGRLAGVEVKAAATVATADFRGLTKLRDTVGDRFCGGVVLYDGEDTLPFGDRLRAMPLRRLWEG